MNYFEIALTELTEKGVTAEALIDQFPVELRRFRLACDMGEAGISLSPAREKEHPLMPAAQAWIKEAATWPIRESIAGIEVPLLENALMHMTKEHSFNLVFIPLSMQSEALRIEAAARDGRILHRIDPKFQSDAVRLAALSNLGIILALIPDNEQSELMRLTAVNNYGMSLKHISPENQSKSVRLAAVKNIGLALEYIPPAYQTEEIRLAAVKQDGMALAFIPVSDQSEQVRKIAVKNCVAALQYIPMDEQSRELKLVAIKANRDAIHYMRTSEANDLLASLTFIGKTRQLFKRLYPGNNEISP